MTVPARASGLSASRTATSARRRGTVPTPAPARGRETGPQRERSAAVARAYARRAQRTGARHGAVPSVDAGRAPFVMLVMILLGVGLVTTLWLSTAATADSYHLHTAHKDARNLTERSESLARQVAASETAPELARRARSLGMVPAGDAARLVVQSDGGVVVIGEPRRALAAVSPVSPPAAVSVQLPPAPVPPVPATPEAPAATPPGQP